MAVFYRSRIWHGGGVTNMAALERCTYLQVTNMARGGHLTGHQYGCIRDREVSLFTIWLH